MVAKLSVSLDDDLAAELKHAAGDNVSAFVAHAVRRQLEQRQLETFLAELEDELGPVDEEEVEAIVTTLRKTIEPSRGARKRTKARAPARRR
jgi:hypothetical protein